MWNCTQAWAFFFKASFYALKKSHRFFTWWYRKTKAFGRNRYFGRKMYWKGSSFFYNVYLIILVFIKKIYGIGFEDEFFIVNFEFVVGITGKFNANDVSLFANRFKVGYTRCVMSYDFYIFYEVVEINVSKNACNIFTKKCLMICATCTLQLKSYSDRIKSV